MAAESASNSNESVDEVDAKRRRTIAGLHFDSALDSQSTSALEDLNRKNHGTVGAIVYDSSTGVCFAFCSTGGIWYVAYSVFGYSSSGNIDTYSLARRMKQAGRLGHAGVPGLACRADVIQSPDNHTWLLASSLSGSGEQIMEFDYARSLKSRFEQSLRAEDDSHSSWASSTLQAFVDQELQCKRHAGCIAIDAQLCDGNRVTLSVSHSTSEFGFGFISSSMTEPFVYVSFCCSFDVQSSNHQFVL
jgi:isoaspartyl peptidase/L-asparaginase-like protein (Ntn-hydrolase superfamily)